MYNPPHFEETRPEVLRELIVAHPLGAVVVHGPAAMPGIIDSLGFLGLEGSGRVPARRVRVVARGAVPPVDGTRIACCVEATYSHSLEQLARGDQAARPGRNPGRALDV
mgnify:CR=1 FL=1